MADFAPMKDPRGYLTPEQALSLLEAAPNLRDRLLLQLMYRCGRRVSEVLLLKKEDILWNDRKIIFTILKRKRPIRELKPVDDDTLKMLELYCSPDVSLPGIRKKPTDSKLFPVTRQYVFSLVRKLGKQAGIERVGDKAIHPHHFRHCLHPETRIVLGNGIFSAEEVFNGSETNVVSVDMQTLKQSDSGMIQKSSHQTSFLTIKAGGYELVCSPEHRLFTVGESGLSEIFAKDVRPGMWLAGAKKINMAGKPVFGPDKARFFGYFCGDGTVGKTFREARIREKRFWGTSAAVYLFDKQRELLEFYAMLAERIWKKKAAIRAYKDRNSYKFQLGSIKVVRELESHRLTEKSKKRRVPKPLFGATEQEVREFLAGYYDAEGSSYRFSSASKELLKDVQMLLLRFGIGSHIHSRTRKVTLPRGKIIMQSQHELYVTSQHAFQELIPTLKVLTGGNRFGQGQERIPAMPIVRKLYARHTTNKDRWHGYLHSLLKQAGLKEIKRYAHGLALEKETLNKIIYVFEQLGDSKETSILRRLLEADIRWLKVTACDAAGEGKSYDFAVTHHNLITDGLLSHNSFAVHAVRTGVKTAEDLRKLQMYMGHANINTTSHYLQFSPEELRSLVTDMWSRKKT